MAQSIALLFVFAVFVEGLVTYFISNPNVPQPWLKYVAAVIAIIVCVAYKLDLFALLGATSPIAHVGEILTGFIVGRGSNYLNDFISTFQSAGSKVANVEAKS